MRDDHASRDQIRIVVVDPRPIWADVLRRLLCSAPGIEVVACALALDEAIALVREHEPSVVLVDWEVERGAGRAVTALRSLRTPPTVLAMGIDRDPGFHVAAARAGACGYIAKDSGLADWLAAIEGCAE